jgi:hypothetical protein
MPLEPPPRAFYSDYDELVKAGKSWARSHETPTRLCLQQDDTYEALGATVAHFLWWGAKAMDCEA